MLAAWNPRRDWLLEAVASALDERDVELELLVVDDGSEPPVAELLAGVDDPRLRVLRVPHGGESRARNAGIAAARGDFFRFVDADDVLVPGSTARLLALAEREPVSIAYGATVICDGELRPRWTMRADVQGRGDVACLLGRLFARVPAMLFPRAAVEAAGEWDPGFRVSHDWDFTLRALEHAPLRGDGLPAVLYRKHGGGATTATAAGLAGAQRVLRRWLERHPEARGTRLEQRATAALEAMRARVLATHGRPREALPHLARSLRDPRALAGELRRALPAARAKLGVRKRGE